MTPGGYPQQQQTASSYFDASINQQPSQTQNPEPQAYGANNNNFSTHPESAGPHTPVYVTPKEWQQSVASVFDPSGLKRKWGYEQQLAMQQRGHPSGRYGSIG